MRRSCTTLLACLCLLSSPLQVGAADTAPAPAERPWMNATLNPEQRTKALLAAMTQDEKLTLVFGYFSSDAPWKNFKKPEGGLAQSAGYVPGIPRLGIPALLEADAGIGVASQPGDSPKPSTSLPSNLATAATWDPELAFAGGQMIGSEARATGFNVMLAGGINLVRDPRGGRTFEYGGEDPWLSAGMVAAQIRGVQSNHLISTIKHFALNAQETNRNALSANIDERSARMSDLLAFELAIEQSQPGAVMCAYNRVNSVYSCENPWLLNQVLKNDWGYKGFVMSDWGGTHSTVPAANAGLDRQSGYPFDASPYFSDALREAVENGHVPQARLDDMAGRILWAMFGNGLFEHPPKAGDIDFKAHADITRADAEGAIVLLKNERSILPLSAELKSIAVIGSHADVGVLSGGGSSQVYGPEGPALLDKEIKHGPQVYHRSSPMQALATRSHAKLTYHDGADIKAASKLAAASDVVIVFASQWAAEGVDGTLRLDGDQDALITALAKANRSIVVVLQTGGPVLMPWLDKVAGVVEAWYPGSSGGIAIARVLSGEVNPSGHLPLTFPSSLDQLPRPKLDGYPAGPKPVRIDVDYRIEGAAVGYKWFDRQGLKPLFPFGYGLSYSRFAYSGLKAQADKAQVQVAFTAANAGTLAGQDVAQIYVSTPKIWEAPKRLAGFRKVKLQPGERSDIKLSIDPRLLAVYEPTQNQWVIAEGDYRVILARDAATPVETVTLHLQRQVLPR
jgi:beta-glucosidase